MADTESHGVGADRTGSSSWIEENPRYYKHISVIVLVAFACNGTALIVFNLAPVAEQLVVLLGPTKTFVLQLFFWASLGGTIAASLFLTKDKELNELEALKPDPDPNVLRYPNLTDVVLYLQRIVTAGFLGVIAVAITMAGLGYFDATPEQLLARHRVFLIVLCFLVGVYQRTFLGTLEKLSRRLLAKDSHASNKGG